MAGKAATRCWSKPQSSVLSQLSHFSFTGQVQFLSFRLTIVDKTKNVYSLNTMVSMKAAAETIALFGATGGTGREFLSLALHEGYNIRALVRTPSKLDAALGEHPHLTVIKGTLQEIDCVKEVVEGSKYVVCMAAPTDTVGFMTGLSYPKDCMSTFVKALVPIMQAQKCQVFFYQAGAFCPAPNTEPLPMFARVLRDVVVKSLLGGGPLLEDHGKVIAYLDQECRSESFGFVVARPGQLLDGESQEELVGSPQPPVGGVTRVDLAQYALSSLKNKSLYGTFYTPVPKSQLRENLKESYHSMMYANEDN